MGKGSSHSTVAVRGLLTGVIMLFAVICYGQSPVTDASDGFTATVKARMADAATLTLLTQYIGPVEGNVKVSQDEGILTDDSLLFGAAVKMPVKRILVDGIDLYVDIHHIGRLHNKKIHTLIITIDSTTGNLLKIATPKPKSNGLRLLAGKKRVADFANDGYVLKPTKAIPKITLFAAVKKSGDSYLFEDTTEIVAYFGNLTDQFRKSIHIKDKPCWCIYFGGVHKQGSCPAGGTPPILSEGYVIIDATTGVLYFEGLRGQS